jgi:hypothetical protein
MSGSARRHGADDEEEIENIKEKFELYKMVRKIEPELPPLTPLPKLMSVRPESPHIDYNWSEKALEIHSFECKVESIKEGKKRREKTTERNNIRREKQIQIQTDEWSWRLAQKNKQADEALAARRPGAPKSVPPSVVAEKWLVAYSLVAFLRKADKIRAINHMTEEKKAELEQQKIALEKQAELLALCLIDPIILSRLTMLTKMFQKRIAVRDMSGKAALIWGCMKKWDRKADVFFRIPTLWANSQTRSGMVAKNETETQGYKRKNLEEMGKAREGRAGTHPLQPLFSGFTHDE